MKIKLWNYFKASSFYVYYLVLVILSPMCFTHLWCVHYFSSANSVLIKIGAFMHDGCPYLGKEQLSYLWRDNKCLSGHKTLFNNLSSVLAQFFLVSFLVLNFSLVHKQMIWSLHVSVLPSQCTKKMWLIQLSSILALHLTAYKISQFYRKLHDPTKLWDQIKGPCTIKQIPY